MWICKKRNVKSNQLTFSIQSLQYEASPNTIDELIECVKDAFNKLERNTLDTFFVTLQTCMESIMLEGGGNSNKIPQ